MNIGRGFGDFFQWDVEELSGIGQEVWEEETELSAGHWTKLNNSVFAEKENKLFLEPPGYAGYSRYPFS